MKTFKQFVIEGTFAKVNAQLPERYRVRQTTREKNATKREWLRWLIDNAKKQKEIDNKEHSGNH